MKMFRIVVLAIIAIVVTGFAAAYTASFLAMQGVFGSCFEGGCGYGAVFVGFPIAWVALLAITLIGYLIWRRAGRPSS